MCALHIVRIMPYTADILNKIVLDVEKYPSFLPWCKKVDIIEQYDNIIIADLFINFKFFSLNYRSKIFSLHNNDLFLINISGISGPFNYLSSIWKITDLHNNSEVDFTLDFKIKSKVLDKLLKRLLSKATHQMIKAFSDRAKNFL